MRVLISNAMQAQQNDNYLYKAKEDPNGRNYLLGYL